MKKYLAVCAAATLCFSLANAQEAEPGTGAELTVVPRIDFGGSFPTGNGVSHKGDFNLGNSSLYSLFEGNLTDNLSFSVCNHWGSFAWAEGSFDSEPLKDLYKYTWRSDWTNWCDWAYLDYAAGAFNFTLGKQVMFLGGMEFEDYDYDCHLPLMSSLWSNFSPYQWGAAAGWTNDSENTTLALQIATSPYGERPFGSGLYSYGAKWTGEYGPLSNIWSVAHIDTGDGFYDLVSLGQTVSVNDDLGFTLDWSNAVCDENLFLLHGHSLYASANWAACEKLDLKAKCGMEKLNGFSDKFWTAGCTAEWFPLCESRDLRIHANLAWRGGDGTGTVYATIGATYYLNLHIGK